MHATLIPLSREKHENKTLQHLGSYKYFWPLGLCAFETG